MEKIGLKIHNFFDAVLENVETGERRTYRAYNQVLDNYFNRLRSSSNAIVMQGIAVGTGTGELSLARTTLFNHLAANTFTEVSSEILSHNRCKRVVSTTFTELQAIGVLTEVGLSVSTGSAIIVTHALFTDSENNPITITKTNLDRLTITATIFAEYTLSGPLERFGNKDDNYVISTKLAYNNEVGKALSSAGTLLDMLVGKIKGLAHGKTTVDGWPAHYYLAHYPDSPVTDCTCAYKTGSTYSSVTGNLVRSSVSEQIQSTQANLDATYQIRSISLGYLFYLSFPNHDIYPPKQLTFELVGDGTTTGFNLGIPELMSDNLVVSVDGVVLSSSDYTFNGRDVSMWQGMPSADNRYIIEFVPQGDDILSRRAVTTLLPGTIATKATEFTIIYDFQSSITLDTIVSARSAELFYSNDGNIWTSAVVLTKTTGDAETASFSPITARYWKFIFTPYRSTANPDLTANTSYRVGFYLNKPQIEFNSPPADGALIEVKAYTEYPIKNSNWIIDQTIFDVTVERGDSE